MILAILQLIAWGWWLTVERTVGLPWLSILWAQLWLAGHRQSTLNFLALLLIQSFGVALVYDLSWALLMIIILAGQAVLVWGELVIPDRKRRLIVVMLLANLLILWLAAVPLTSLVWWQLIISYLLMVSWLRIIKVRQLAAGTSKFTIFNHELQWPH